MKSLTRILIAVLIATSLIPIKIGLICLFDQTAALEFFKMENLTPDLMKIYIVLGGFILATTVLPFFAIYFLIKHKPEGYLLAYLSGVVTFLRGILTMVLFSSKTIDDTKLAVTPLIFGFLIVLFTHFARLHDLKKTNPLKPLSD